MERYYYKDAVMNDVKNALSDYDLTKYEDADEAYEAIYDDLYEADSVTGGASGSYTFSTWEAEENLAHNWEEIITTAEEFGIDAVITDEWNHGAEWWDVAIRCRYLSECLTEALEEFF